MSREFMSFSRKEISRFCGFLREEESFANVIDLDALEEDLQEGWYLDSDVPVGYGMGSSGTFFKRFQKLTSAQRFFFSPMIPDPVAELFERTYDFHFGVKIPGSGGGGYILGFTDDRQKASTVLRDKKVL